MIGTAIEKFRAETPEQVRVMAQLVLDNPRELALVGAGSIVVSKILLNAVRPRGLLEGLAVIVVASMLCGAGGAELVRRGYLNFKVRDQAGCLVPLRDRDPEG